MRWLLLSLALISQAPPAPEPEAGQKLSVAGAKSVPAYSLAKLKASNATAPLQWAVYQLVPVGSMQSGQEFGFTAPPGQYLVQLTSANGEATWRIIFTPPNGPLPNPGPGPTPTPQPIPSPPQPQPDPDTGFVYPPDASSFGASVSAAVRGSQSSTPLEVTGFSSLYRFTAEKIRLDGTLIKPELKTLADAMALTKTTEQELVKRSRIRPIKQAFPEVAKLAAAELSQANPADPLTPDARKTYVEFLNQLASGFDQAAPK